MKNNLNDIIKNYPYAYKILYEFYKKKMEDAATTERLKEFTASFSTPESLLPYILSLVENVPRVIFDMLDENGIFININVYKIEEALMFRYSFDEKVESIDYSSRISCERDAIEDGIKYLNEKLEKNEKNK